ncbi:MAG: TatD family deoxyribonuclease [Alphaproteobacteria bacterium]|nr:TatD family deoxyribonuclease [Alphaproteobacteria bacterium]
MLVDSHCHLDFADFESERDEIVARARRAGVGLIVTICTKVSEFDRVLAIAERYDDVYCSVGIHPHEAAAEPAVDAARLIELARHPRVVGIGETGLDYFYEHSPRADQARSFRAHIAAARATGLPLIVHTRDADYDMAEILREEQARGSFSGVLHCFSSGQALAETAIGLGLYISMSGIVTFKKADALRTTVAAMPTERLLVETDAPYLAPIPNRGRRNEPAFVIHTAAEVGRIKGLGAAEIADVTTRNFLRLFTKIAPPAPCA